MSQTQDYTPVLLLRAPGGAPSHRYVTRLDELAQARAAGFTELVDASFCLYRTAVSGSEAVLRLQRTDASGATALAAESRVSKFGAGWSRDPSAAEPLGNEYTVFDAQGNAIGTLPNDGQLEVAGVSGDGLLLAVIDDNFGLSPTFEGVEIGARQFQYRVTVMQGTTAHTSDPKITNQSGGLAGTHTQRSKT